MTKNILTINRYGKEPIKLELDWDDGWFPASEDNVVATIEVPVSSIVNNAICGVITLGGEKE